MRLVPPDPYSELQKIAKSLQYCINPLEELIVSSDKQKIAENSKEVKNCMRQLISLLNLWGSSNEDNDDLTKLQSSVLEISNKTKVLFEIANKLQSQLNPDFDQLRQQTQDISVQMENVLVSTELLLYKSPDKSGTENKQRSESAASTSTGYSDDNSSNSSDSMKRNETFVYDKPTIIGGSRQSAYP